MGDVQSREAEISERMTWNEICLRYPDEWVVLVEIDGVNDTDFEFRSARVAGHGRTRKAPLQQARAPASALSVDGPFLHRAGSSSERSAILRVKVTRFDPGDDLILVPVSSSSESTSTLPQRI